MRERKPGLIQKIFDSVDKEVETTRHGDFGDSRDGIPELNINNIQNNQSLLGKIKENLRRLDRTFQDDRYHSN